MTYLGVSSLTKWNYVFGAVTIGLIVGGTIYAIKKSKDAEKQEEAAITLEEARDIVARSKQDTEGEATEEVVHFQAPIVHTTEEMKQAPISHRLYELEDEEEEMDEGIAEIVEDEPTYGVSPGGLTITPIVPLNEFRYFEEGIDPKEDKELRYDKDSEEARHQFIRMELADWGDEFTHPVYRIMLQLFEVPLYPTNVGDDLLRTQIIDYKADFFGITSRWVKEVSFADIIFHYARSATFNCGESIQYWVEYFMDFNAFEWDMTTRELDTIVLRLANHSYFNEERHTFGLFGLTPQSMDQALATASRNPDRSVTFEIEFQEFLKTCL